MCAVPMKGLHKSGLSLEAMTRIQDLVKRRIPTGAGIYVGMHVGILYVHGNIGM